MQFESFRDLDRLASQLWNGALPQRAMPMDAYRDGNEYVVHFDMPGVDPASIDVTVEKNVLTVTARRSWTRKEGTQTVASERLQGTFNRQLFLSDTLDAANIEASYQDGVLTVKIPLAEKAQPRRIAVSGGGKDGSKVAPAAA